jgi:hypothetical protein
MSVEPIDVVKKGNDSEVLLFNSTTVSSSLSFGSQQYDSVNESILCREADEYDRRGVNGTGRDKNTSSDEKDCLATWPEWSGAATAMLLLSL